MAEMTKTAPPMPEGGIVPRRDIKPLADEIDAILREAGLAEGGAGGPETGMAPASSKSPEGERNGTGRSEPAAAGMAQDASVIAEVLGVSMEKAQALLDAAMQMPKMAGKSPAEIADMLSKDMNLRMQLEKNLGAGADMMAKKAMAEEGMKAPAPLPTEPSMGKM